MTTADKIAVTYSAMQTSCCWRKYYLKYILLIRRGTPGVALMFGTAIHAGLEAYQQGEDVATAIEAAKSAYFGDNQPQAHELNVRQMDTFEMHMVWIEVLLTAYYQFYLEDDAAKLKYLETEKQFEMPLVNPATGAASRTFFLAGKIDGVAEGSHHTMFGMAVVEHKTTSSDITPGSDYWLRLLIDSQITIYNQAAQHLGHDVEGCLYDVIKKPTTKPLQVPLLDEDGLKIVLDADGNRVYNEKGAKTVVDDDGLKIVLDQNGNRVIGDDGVPKQRPNKELGEYLKVQKVPRQSADTKKGWVLQTRKETSEEYGDRLFGLVSENPDAYFQRKYIPRLEDDLKEGAFDIWQTAKQIHECTKANRWPRKTSMCTLYGGCELFPLCSSGWVPGEALPEGFFVSDKLHEELD